MGRRTRPPKGKAKAERPLASKSPTDESARVRELEKRLAEALKREAEALEEAQRRNRELVEAQEQQTATLFKELQASNHDLATALDKQTATSDVLRVISRSQTDVQPVFDAIVQSAVRTCKSADGFGQSRTCGCSMSRPVAPCPDASASLSRLKHGFESRWGHHLKFPYVL